MKLALAADLHFGSVPDGLAVGLRDAIEREAPSLIVIAGDLTLRARKKEFEQARNWLKSLAIPALVLPGNHDLPYWNLLRRFTDPFQAYRKLPGARFPMPAIEHRDGLVLGFNTARSWQPHLQWQEGVARRNDIEAAAKALSSVPNTMFKAVAAHHPFIKAPNTPRAKAVGRASHALEVFAGLGVNLLMSGHTHRSFATEFEVGGRPLVAIGAPTALSSRLRGEANGFWIVETASNSIKCDLWLHAGRDFEQVGEKIFHRF